MFYYKTKWMLSTPLSVYDWLPPYQGGGEGIHWLHQLPPYEGGQGGDTLTTSAPPYKGGQMRSALRLTPTLRRGRGRYWLRQLPLYKGGREKRCSTTDPITKWGKKMVFYDWFSLYNGVGERLFNINSSIRSDREK